MPLELEIDVPESRQVTLPPEVPVGKVKVTVQTPGVSSRLERFGLLRELGPVTPVIPESEADMPQVVGGTPVQ